MVQKVETMGLYEYGRIDLDPDGCDSLFIFEREGLQKKIARDQ